jgi:tetratricopeptide (TPR) repeat protein
VENYYELLQVDSSISNVELKEALLNQQRKWLGRTNAPDLKRRQEAERMVELLEQAQQTLLDDAKRETYNKELESSKYETSKTESNSDLDTTQLGVDALVEEAWSLIEKGRYADAVVVGKRATEKGAGHASAWAVLARAHYMWNDFDDAVYEYRKAIDIAINNDVYYYDLSDVYIDHPRLSEAEKLDQAESLIKKALNIKPNERAYLFRLAVIARFRGKYDEAIGILNKLIEQYGKDPSLGDEVAFNLYRKCLSKLHKQVLNGEEYFYYISKENAEEGLKILKEAKIYATDKSLLEYIQKFIDLGEQALKSKFLVGRFIGWGIIPGFWFLGALISLSFFQIIISGALLFLAWKFSRMPVWKDTYERVTGVREKRNRNIATILAGVAAGLRKR